MRIRRRFSNGLVQHPVLRSRGCRRLWEVPEVNGRSAHFSRFPDFGVYASTVSRCWHRRRRYPNHRPVFHDPGKGNFVSLRKKADSTIRMGSGRPEKEDSLGQVHLSTHGLHPVRIHILTIEYHDRGITAERLHREAVNLPELFHCVLRLKQTTIESAITVKSSVGFRGRAAACFECGPGNHHRLARSTHRGSQARSRRDRRNSRDGGFHAIILVHRSHNCLVESCSRQRA